MKSASPTLLPLLRSRTQGDVLAWILLHPEGGHTLTEIAEAVGTSAPTVMREVDRLSAAGLVTSLRRGNTRQVRAVTDSPIYQPLAELMALTFGPLPVLRDLLVDVPGIDEAYIYGSWAARYHEQPGAVPGDIDVLVVGDIDVEALDAAVAAAERRLRREVNVRRVRPAVWAADQSSFKATVMSRPLVTIVDEATTDV